MREKEQVELAGVAFDEVHPMPHIPFFSRACAHKLILICMFLRILSCLRTLLHKGASGYECGATKDSAVGYGGDLSSVQQCKKCCCVFEVRG